ncbi:hypothetical protein POSPLADRAFT_1127489 [Postia placenta MAD-698-R-SB12]|uniref:Rab-GAP TBC domain-containing protein n=1 Tax=Postia placenta MAD-698-R-SB12 TaxID=670580 RepID=A0A1X6NEQ8_9APHY|nr:hypothetical protein POSPLADRAFT_1127489 [Postia placenta MAD-698-R-SB12]OSX66936.1 hypothetical protein POSPLADRAFT_1127489 [Postia placenta MAD-698-R-SB12]
MDDHTPPGDTHGGHVEHAYAVSPPHFAFDDAFSDADDAEERLEFSPEAIREDIAKTFTNLDKHVAQDEAEDFARKIGFAVDSNTSVSTFDIDAAASEPRSPAASPPGMVRSMSTASHVTSLASPGSLYDIPLSESASGLRISDEPSSYFHEHDAAEQVRDAIPERKSSPKPAQEHPPVVVEVKSDPVHETDNYVEVAPRSVSHDEFRARTVSPQPTTPQSAASIVSSLSAASIASTSTSHIPTSASLPSPASNASNVSNMSNMSNMSTTSTTSAPSTFQHRQVRSLGPSALDRFISHTRPSFLPPKPRTEDKKHLADWEAMMKRSRVAEEKRRKALQERRYARERKIEESIGIWERDIVPDWTVVQRNPAMRKLWWGGIPTKLRATMWQNAAGRAGAYKNGLLQNLVHLGHAAIMRPQPLRRNAP